MMHWRLGDAVRSCLGFTERIYTLANEATRACSINRNNFRLLTSLDDYKWYTPPKSAALGGTIIHSHSDQYRTQARSMPDIVTFHVRDENKSHTKGARQKINNYPPYGWKAILYFPKRASIPPTHTLRYPGSLYSFRLIMYYTLLWYTKV
jgi:hypothetical protein